MPTPEFLVRIRERAGTELMMLPSVGGCVFDEHGRLLLALHTDIWAMPGGILEPDERPAEAVVRELREETGLEVAVRGLIGVSGGPNFRHTYANGDRVAYMTAFYGCEIVGGSLRPDGEEIADAVFFAPDELPGLRLAPWMPEVAPLAYAWWETAAYRSGATVGENV
ncbi:NUDIX domain-containing protein [Rhizohabitans arisaemae]|uniref:NUDIX domain-containing protein n=1 Tax=Rhizohabitans arisaemae TaxID=2720610 RepID=UPI0024B2695D|nr:NUDIX domain-containing protein [Rhizohabitans arisaemae]